MNPIASPKNRVDLCSSKRLEDKCLLAGSKSMSRGSQHFSPCDDSTYNQRTEQPKSLWCYLALKQQRQWL